MTTCDKLNEWAYGASRPHCDVAITGYHPYLTESDRPTTIA